MGFQNMYIAASAGAGKTYQLVGRFITLLCIQEIQKAPGASLDVSRLIAITFTRKAAGEFKSRILADLASAARDEESAQLFWQARVAPCLSDLGVELSCPAGAHAFFLSLLRELMKQFSALNLSTIDGLFQRMVRSIASELGLLKLEAMDPVAHSAVRRQILDDCYLRLQDSSQGAQQDQYKLLYEIVLSILEEGKELSKPDLNIFELINAFHSLYLSHADALWGCAKGAWTQEHLEPFHLKESDLDSPLSAQELQAQVALFNELYPEAEDLPELLKSGKEYHVEHSPIMMEMHHSAARAYTHQFINFVRSLGNLKGDIQFVVIKAYEGEPYPERTMRAVRYADYWDLCRADGIDLDAMVKSHRALRWQNLFQRTHAIYELIEQFEQLYQQEVRQSGIYSFSDFERALQGRVNEASFMLMQERMDARLEHWLLDEFQDTSASQYAILRDLLINRAQSDGDGSVFMVGDAKQSIYQFRGGDPSIFLQTREELFGLDSPHQNSSREKPLNVSYRSAPVILEMCNLFFGEGFRANTALSRPQAQELWEGLHYQEHKATRQDLAACAEIWEYGIPSAKAQGPTNLKLLMSKEDSMFHCLATLLLQHRPLHQAKIPSCAILVNTKSQGQKIYLALKALQEQYPFAGPITLCDDKDVGTDSPLGKALMQFFRWLNSPGDNKSLSLLKLSPLWQCMRSQAKNAENQDLWLQWRGVLEAGGYSHVLKTLIKGGKEALICNDFMRQRWQIWLQAAEKFDRNQQGISAWIDFMSKQTVREEAQGQAIRIMTIHKAKGLEFDMVFLPQASTTSALAEYKHLSHLSQRDPQTGKQLVLLCPDKQMVESQHAFKQSFIESKLAEEEFAGYCKFYVALTRAKQACFILMPCIAKQTSERESMNSMLSKLIQNHPQHCHRPQTNGQSYLDEMFGQHHVILSPAMQGPALNINQEHLLFLHAEAKNNMDEAETLTTPIASCNFHMGTSNWWAHTEQNEPEERGDEVQLVQEEKLYQFANLERSTPSTLDRDRDHSEEEPSLQSMRPLQESGGAQYGTVVHGLLEKVAWLEDGLPEWGACVGASPELVQREQKARASVLKAIQSEAWRPYLTRGEKSVRLYKEQNIEAILDKHWVSGQIDRLHVYYANGEEAGATGAHIIDFKTDANLMEKEGKMHYRHQMMAYRRMVAGAFCLPLESVRVSLLHCPAWGEAEAWDYEAGGSVTLHPV